MEEDIKVLEELIQPIKERPIKSKIGNYLTVYEYKISMIERQAIENLIKRNKELEESNHNLLLIAENSILKSEVREMIEKLEKRIDNLRQMEDSVARSIGIEDCQEKIFLLQELLQEGDK